VEKNKGRKLGEGYMKIAFIGDIHGRIFHAIATILTWQIVNNQKFDMIIQVGDFGAYPKPDGSMLSNKFVLEDPTELDFSKYINADLELQNDLRYIREHLICPIHFIKGNHEDFQWLNLISENGTKIAAIDKVDLIRYIPDGTVKDFQGVRLAFLGGIETSEQELRSIDYKAYNKLLENKPGDIDILVTHDSPYGTGISFTGEVQGSRKITELVKSIQPKYLIAGHYHHMIGPLELEKTKYIGLNILIAPMKKDKSGCVQQGSLAVLDTTKGVIEFVKDDWLTNINKSLKFSSFIQKIKVRRENLW
jgi:Icc-related predicted phosphoesterase